MKDGVLFTWLHQLARLSRAEAAHSNDPLLGEEASLDYEGSGRPSRDRRGLREGCGVQGLRLLLLRAEKHTQQGPILRPTDQGAQQRTVGGPHCTSGRGSQETEILGRKRAPLRWSASPPPRPAAAMEPD